MTIKPLPIPSTAPLFLRYAEVHAYVERSLREICGIDLSQVPVTEYAATVEIALRHHDGIKRQAQRIRASIDGVSRE